MAFDNSSCGPVSNQGSSQDKVASKKPSTYIFDSNGDTQLILNTYSGQTFIWEAETIRIGQERSGQKCSKKENKKKKKKKNAPPVPPPAPLMPLAPPGSHVPIPGSFQETTDRSSLLSDVAYRRPGISDDETIEPGLADAEKNADSLRMQDGDYGERSGYLPDQVEIRMMVSGKHLELASLYFEKMFSGPFTEAKANPSGLRRVTATDWDPEAFNIVLTIMHGYHRNVPKSLSLDMYAKLAMIVDYYECHEIIEVYGNIWSETLKPEVPKIYGRDCILYMFISWVFSQPEMFQKMAQLALRHSGKLIEAEDVPIPSDLLEQIDTARQDYLDKVFSAIYDLVDHLQGESEYSYECSYECSSMLLGVLIKELKKNGILSPRSAQPFYGLSIEGSKDMIERFKIPLWYGAGSGRYGAHNCTIQQKLSLTLEKAEKELRIFNLQDFQLGQTHIRPPKNVGAFEFEFKRNAT